MKILYIYFGGNFSWTSSGVQKKVISKVNAINELGHHCDCISFSSSIEEEVKIGSHIRVFPITKSKRQKFFNTLREQQDYYVSLIAWLKNNIQNYDVLIMRYPLASKGLYHLVKTYSKKIVFEHNTKELEEVLITQKQDRKKIAFAFKPGFFFYFLEIGLLPYLFEKYFAPKIFKHALLGVSVTKEIATYESNRCVGYQNKVITNGIDVDSCSLRLENEIINNEINLFILTGGNVPWHGVERIISGIKNYKGSANISVDIIGSFSTSQVQMALELGVDTKINFIPHIEYSLLTNHLNKYHAGIGTLAAFRKGLKEASPLKVREYFARGFACVVGYEDTDINEYKEFDSYVLKVPADESPLDFYQIETFVKQLYTDKKHHLKIRELATRFLDTKVKMQQLTNILKSLDIQRNRVVKSS